MTHPGNWYIASCTPTCNFLHSLRGRCDETHRVRSIAGKWPGEVRQRLSYQWGEQWRNWHPRMCCGFVKMFRYSSSDAPDWATHVYLRIDSLHIATHCNYFVRGINFSVRIIYCEHFHRLKSRWMMIQSEFHASRDLDWRRKVEYLILKEYMFIKQ